MAHKVAHANNKLRFVFICFGLPILFCSCSLQRKISSSAQTMLLNTPELKNAHTGISIYEPATDKYWLNYQADKYFTPASNTKIFTCYAAMKYLGDSLAGIGYVENDTAIYLIPTGDPSLLHADYKKQPVIDFLQHAGKSIYVLNTTWKDNAQGAGWSWDDYNDDYAAERSALPVYGNTIKFVQTQTSQSNGELGNPSSAAIFTDPEINWKINFNTNPHDTQFAVRRSVNENIFTVTEGREKYKEINVPFVTNGISSALELLKDTIGKSIGTVNKLPSNIGPLQIITSQPIDSVLTPMMHRSDNFFAEQLLLMISQQWLGQMNDRKITDSLLSAALKELPQKPAWADGSGLSRFNLFTPQDFVWLLNKMKNEFSWKRLSHIFASGNTGTLTNYYVADSTFIHAKTGSLSGVIALSGFLTTRKNKTLIFSVLVNNHNTNGRAVRRAVEKFIKHMRENY